MLLNIFLALGLADNVIGIILRCINFFCPRDVFGSDREFLQFFDTPDTANNYVCTNKLGQGPVTVTGNKLQCSVCRKFYSRNELLTERSYFKYQSLEPQLATIVENETLVAAMEEHKANAKLNSIVQSSNYKSLTAANTIGKYDITLQINTDGVNATKSSNLSFWPIFVTINELPLPLRTSNMLLVGVWMGKNKPNMNTYLKPLTEELKDLHRKGIKTSNDNVVKVHCLVSPVDSPARADMICLQHPGGKYACPWCHQRAESVIKGRGTTRILRVEKTIDKKRTLKKYGKFNMRRYKENKEHHKGVKGVAALASVKPFDIVDGFVVDYLHAFCVGLFNHYLEYITHADHAKEPYSIRKTLENADQIMMKVTPPHELKRLPDALSNYKSMKASLKKDIFCYYLLPILAAVNFPQEYLNHVFLVIYSFRKYLQTELSTQESIKARLALEKFVAELSKLFDEKFLIFNTHIITHVPDICERWGGLWDANTFNYEGKNGLLAKLHHGTIFQPDQILRNYARLKVVRETEYASREYSRSDFKELYIELLDNKKRCKEARRVGSCVLLGAAKTVTADSPLFQKVQQNHPGMQFQLVTYNRFIYNRILACTRQYSRLQKRRNNVLKTSDGKAVAALALGVCRLVSSGQEYVYILIHELAHKNTILARCDVLQIDSTDFLHEVEESEEDIVIEVEKVKQKLICFDVIDKTYICELVNIQEGD